MERGPLMSENERLNEPCLHAEGIGELVAYLLESHPQK